MARPIDADALWRKFENESWYDNEDRDEIALQLVDDAPTVDAVPVVRCRDCKIHGHCATEDVFSFSGISNPFCCAGKKGR